MISGSAFVAFIFFSLISYFFSFAICSNNSSAVPSSGNPLGTVFSGFFIVPGGSLHNNSFVMPRIGKYCHPCIVWQTISHFSSVQADSADSPCIFLQTAQRIFISQADFRSTTATQASVCLYLTPTSVREPED